MRIVCTGSIAYDYLMSFPGYFRENILPEHLDKISVSFLVDDMVRQRGGTAPNIAYTLALLGEHPHLMGTVGVDFADYDAWLKSKNVEFVHKPRVVSQGEQLELWAAMFRDPDGHAMRLIEQE